MLPTSYCQPVFDSDRAGHDFNDNPLQSTFFSVSFNKPLLSDLIKDLISLKKFCMKLMRTKLK